MKMILFVLVWGILLFLSPAAKGENSDQTDTLASHFESFCRHFNDMRSTSTASLNTLYDDWYKIEQQLQNDNVLPQQNPLGTARARCVDRTKAFEPECLYAFYWDLLDDYYFFQHVDQDKIRGIFVDIWLLHPSLRQRCLPVLNKKVRDIDAKARLAVGLSGSDAEIPDVESWKNVLFGSYGAYLRAEIDKYCTTKPVDQTFCASLPELVKLVYAYDAHRYRTLAYAQWHPYRLHFVMLKHNFPDEFDQAYPTTDLEVSELIVKNLERIFKYIGKGELDKVRDDVMPFVPDLTTIKSGCETTWNLPSNLKKSECMFWKAIIQLEAYLKSKVAPASGKVVKVLNTNIDYPTFLSLTEMDRILQIAQNQETALQELTQWVNEEVSKTVNERFDGLQTYFQKVETFNREKANADIGYINGRLEKYKTNIDSLSTQLGDQLGVLINYAIAAVSLELAEDTAQMAMAAAVVMNPLEKLFGGSSAGDFVDRTAKLAQTLTLVGEMIERSQSYNELVDQALDIRERFNQNADFLENVRVLVDSIHTGTSTTDFETRKQEFLDQYTAYDPQVEKPELAAMVAKWEDMIDGTCEVILGTETALAAVTVAFVRTEGLCPKAKVKAQEMIATYEEVYDFQFELIETMATYMRAATALDASSSIAADYDELSSEPTVDETVVNDLKTLTLVSYISYQTNIWQIMESYCDILEYKLGGVRPSVCQGIDTDIASLASYLTPTCTDRTIVYNDVPIKSDSDQAFMNLTHLYSGKPVTFKIPNGQWLVTNEWITAADQNAPIFLKALEVFLPTESATHRRVRVQAKVTGWNQHSPPDGTTYVIARVPEKKFIYEYLEGHGASDQCRKDTDLLNNPYGSSLPDMCTLNVDQNSCQEMLDKTSLFPSVYSQWQVSVSGYESVSVPVPATDFKLKVGVKLCIWEDRKKDKMVKKKDEGKIRMLSKKNKKKKNKKKEKLGDATSCLDGQYWSVSSGSCTSCPKGSRSALHGYYCKKIPKKG